MKLTYFATIFSIVILSCQYHRTKLEKALETAGNNRQELEKVLTHYTRLKDSLKLEAAKFLIENMPGHYTLQGDLIDSFRFISKHAQNVRFEKKSIDTKGTIKTITQDSITYFDTKIFDIAFNYPFILNSRGEIKYLEPNRRKTQNLILTRKYPANELLLKYCKNLEGIIIEASNDPLFERKKETLFSL